MFNKKIVKKYLARKNRFLETYIFLRRLVDILYDIQDVRMRTANRLRGLPKEVLGIYVAPLLELEKETTKRIKDFLKDLPEYEVFKDIKGIGTRLAGSWISSIMIRYDLVDEKDLKNYSELQQEYKFKTKDGKFRVPTIRGITAFSFVSHVWSWCGLSVIDGHAPRMVSKTKSDFNPKMRTLTWKTRKQFIIQGDLYRKLYDIYKKELTETSRYAVALQNPEFCPRYEECKERLGRAAKRLGREMKKFPCKGHIDSMASVKMVKDFIKHFYIRWLEMEGLPVPPPYDHEHRHHEA